MPEPSEEAVDDAFEWEELSEALGDDTHMYEDDEQADTFASPDWCPYCERPGDYCVCP